MPSNESLLTQSFEIQTVNPAELTRPQREDIWDLTRASLGADFGERTSIQMATAVQNISETQQHPNRSAGGDLLRGHQRISNHELVIATSKSDDGLRAVLPFYDAASAHHIPLLWPLESEAKLRSDHWLPHRYRTFGLRVLHPLLRSTYDSFDPHELMLLDVMGFFGASKAHKEQPASQYGWRGQTPDQVELGWEDTTASWGMKQVKLMKKEIWLYGRRNTEPLIQDYKREAEHCSKITDAIRAKNGAERVLGHYGLLDAA